jgi:hypothetical protein
LSYRDAGSWLGVRVNTSGWRLTYTQFFCDQYINDGIDRVEEEEEESWYVVREEMKGE